MGLVLLAVGNQGWVVGLVGLLGGALAAVAAYVGWQSLQQAQILNKAVPYGALRAKVGQSVAVSGRPRGVRGSYLWIKSRFQEYRRSHSSNGSSHGSWRTVDTQVDANDFDLDCGRGSVAVVNRPTEVHGTRSRTDYDQGGGGGSLFGLISFGMGPRTRVRHDFLPAGVPNLTVCGRLERRGEGAYRIVPDPGVGLLLTPYAAGTQASIEMAKGIGGLVGAPILWLVVMFLLLNQ